MSISVQAYQILTHLYKKYSLVGGRVTSPAQEPTKASSCAFYSMVIVITWILMEHCVNALTLIKSTNLFRALSDISQNRVAGFALLIAQRKVHAVRPTLRFVGEDVVLHSGKPERAGHAAHPRKQIRPVDGVQGEQTGQRVAYDPSPGRNSGNFLLCRWDNPLGQKTQIVIRAAGAGFGIFKGRRTVPGHHIVVPVQIADGHQCERWAASSLCRLVYLLAFIRKGVEIDYRGIGRVAGKNGCYFPTGCKCVHEFTRVSSG